MALLYRATLSPSKQELVESWLPAQSWASQRKVSGKLAEYRFNDPAGEVGVETIMWQTQDGAVLQTPLTYRAAPLANAESHLLGTAEHSVLGQRWVYDGCGDHVWANTLVEAILSGGTQAKMYFEQDGKRVDVPSRMQVKGSGGGGDAPTGTSIDRVGGHGNSTVTRVGEFQITLARVVGSLLAGDLTLTGRMEEFSEPLMLASLRRL